MHAPGVRDLRTAIRAAHHLLLAHGMAVEAFRASGATGQVGLTLNLNPADAGVRWRGGPPRRGPVRRPSSTAGSWTRRSAARYPADLVDHYAGLADLGPDLGCIQDGDLAAIAAPMDFLGVNYYFRNVVSAAPGGLGWERADARRRRRDVEHRLGDRGRAALRTCSTALREDYPALPVYVTENGISLDDEVGPDGGVDDPRRIDYLRRPPRGRGRGGRAGAPTCAAGSSGRCSTTSSGRSATGRGSGSSTSTTRRRPARRRPARAGTRTLIRNNGIGAD